jgi:tetratricopeptide (TPR) repeat protein
MTPTPPRPAVPPSPAAAGRLAEADALREGEAADRRRALDAYRDLRAHLDPARPEDAIRIRWVFENGAERDAAVAELAAAAEGSPDPELRETATLVRGQAAADAGRPEEAEELFRGLLREGRGSGRRIERLACLSLGKLYAHQRRGFEALVISRMAAGLARKAGHLWDLCVARARTCMALQVIDDGERLASAVEELDRALDEVPADRARPLRFLVHGLRTEAALEVGDLDGARRGLEALRSLGDPALGGTGDPRLPLYLEAEIELRSGRPPEALELVRRCRAIPARLATSDLPLAMLEARARAESGDAAGAAGVIRGVLDLLDVEAEPDPLGTGQRIRWSVEGGRLLQDRCGDPEGARRAFDLASGWVLRRIVEVGRVIAQVPELAGIAPEDLRALTDYRNRFVRDQAEIMDRVAALFGDEEPPAELVHGDTPEEGFFLACAWCRRVRSAAGTWLPVGEFLPDDRQLRISHGICRDCNDRWMERVAKS